MGRRKEHRSLTEHMWSLGPFSCPFPRGGCRLSLSLGSQGIAGELQLSEHLPSQTEC